MQPKKARHGIGAVKPTGTTVRTTGANWSNGSPRNPAWRLCCENSWRNCGTVGETATGANSAKGSLRKQLWWLFFGCSYSSAKRDSSFRWAFLVALTQARPGQRPPPAVLRPLVHGSGIQAQFCAAFRCRPARQDDAVGGPSGLGRTAGHAPDDRRRSPSAACLWLQRARQAAGIGGWRASAERWGRHPCARAKPLKGDPAMQLPGQEPLRRGKSVRGRQDSCAVHDLGASDGESAPWRQDVRAVHSPTALCGSFWTHGAHILPWPGAG